MKKWMCLIMVAAVLLTMTAGLAEGPNSREGDSVATVEEQEIIPNVPGTDNPTPPEGEPEENINSDDRPTNPQPGTSNPPEGDTPTTNPENPTPGTPGTEPENPEQPAPAPVPINIQVVPQTPDEVSDIIDEVKTTYTATVRFVDVMGNTVAESQEVKVRAGDTLAISSPDVSSFVLGSGTVDESMPERDVEYTMLYLPAEFFSDDSGDQVWMIEGGANKIAKIITIDNYETPLGLGNVMMNVGIGFE